ncbi:MAG: hypothetical protein JOY77_14340 [Alphaproteobacteria bacterium]|nr:hypothetical protein [Alphaproteobacteria bacterium]
MLCIAHRGGAGLLPENTLSAFRNAIALGCDGAELDVQLSSDGAVVVFHDFCLNPDVCRDSSGNWLAKPTPRIKDLNFAELRSLDVGCVRPESRYAHSHPELVPAEGERIPALGEVLDVARSAWRPFHLFVELKTSFADRSLSADPKALAEAALQSLRNAQYLDRSVLVGFDWTALLHAKRIEPSVQCWFTTQPQSWFGDSPPPAQDDPPEEPVLQRLRHGARTGTSPWAAGYDAVNYGGSILRAIAAAGADGWFPMYRDATAQAIGEAHNLGLRVGAWTANRPPEMRALIENGIDAICTDRPDLLMGVVNSP